MSYVVHGANGAQGGPVLAALLRDGHDAVAAVRNTAAVREARAVSVDNSSVDTLVAAYSGADGVFVHLPVLPEEIRLQYAKSIARAVAIAKPGRVVISTSGWVVDEPNSPLQNPPESAIATLIREVEASGVSTAVVAPRLFLENLLNPVVLEPVRSEGILRYPLRTDYPVSWSSHADVAEVVARLLTTSAQTGVIGVGYSPGLTGGELARSFESYFGRSVVFESITPEAFGKMISPLFGEAAAAGVVAGYQAQAMAHGNVANPATSAEQILGLAPRPMARWLTEILG